MVPDVVSTGGFSLGNLSSSSLWYLLIIYRRWWAANERKPNIHRCWRETSRRDLSEEVSKNNRVIVQFVVSGPLFASFVARRAALNDF